MPPKAPTSPFRAASSCRSTTVPANPGHRHPAFGSPLDRVDAVTMPRPRRWSTVRCAAVPGTSGAGGGAAAIATEPAESRSAVTAAAPAGIKAEVAKLDLSVLPAERRRLLATVGRRLTAQALDR